MGFTDTRSESDSHYRLESDLPHDAQKLLKNKIVIWMSYSPSSQ